MQIEMTVYKYQGVGPFNKGELECSWYERDASSCRTLDLIMIGTETVSIEVEPVEMDCELARKQLKNRAIEEKRIKLQEQLDKLNAA